MKQEIINSIITSLKSLSALSAEKEQNSLDFNNLDGYSEEELKAIDSFLKESLESFSEYYHNYAELLKELQSSQEALLVEIGVAEPQHKTSQEVKKIEKN